MDKSNFEHEAYKYKNSLIHALMIIYGFSFEEARKAVYCEKVSAFLFGNLESKATGRIKTESVQVKCTISNEADIPNIVDKLTKTSY